MNVRYRPIAPWLALTVLPFLPASVQAQAGRINDTGATLCADAASNSVPCGHADGDLYGYPRQEAEYGRATKENSSTLTKTGASDVNSKGFDFTKIRFDNGTVLAAGAAFGTGTNWGCTRDNVTGLIWLIPSSSGNDFRLNTTTRRWYSTDGDRNGGKQGDNRNDAAGECYFALNTGNTTAQSCNTKTLVDYANSLAICGEGTKNDWRVPTRLELLSIVDLSRQGSAAAAADPTYFPNLQQGDYWTQDTLAGNPAQVRVVNFRSGADGLDSKGENIVGPPASPVIKNFVILVRPSP